MLWYIGGGLLTLFVYAILTTIFILDNFNKKEATVLGADATDAIGFAVAGGVIAGLLWPVVLPIGGGIYIGTHVVAKLRNGKDNS